jgi:transketolase
MPSSSVFDRQDARWQQAVLGDPRLPRIGVEAGISRFWRQYGCVDALGVDSFGESGPGPSVYALFGLTVPALVALVARAQARLEQGSAHEHG